MERCKRNIPKAIMEKFERMEIKPFESEGGNNIEVKKVH